MGSRLLLYGAGFASPAALVIALVCARLDKPAHAVVFAFFAIAILIMWLYTERQEV
jgi:hypothetical protein